MTGTSQTDRGAVAAAVAAAARAWIEEGEAEDAVAINRGLCADFADALARGIREDAGIEVGLMSFHDLCFDDPAPRGSIGGFDPSAIARHPGLAPPPGTDWRMLEAVRANLEVCHTWIVHAGLHYDAETPEGCANPLDLYCVRHALAELVQLHRPDLYDALVAEHGWWARTRDIRSLREAAFSKEGLPCP